MEKQDSWDLMLSMGVDHRGWDDPVFQEGLGICSPLIKIPCVDLDEEDFLHSKTEATRCSVMGCRRSFNTVVEHASHQRACHTHVCSTCRHTFPSHHLLDLHLLEAHDTLFLLTAEKRPMYQCFLETCSEKFMNPTERKHHCVKEHKFPSNYRFDTTRKKLDKKIGKHEAKQSKEEPNMEYEDIEDTHSMGTKSTHKDDRKKNIEDVRSSKKNDPKIPNYFSFGSGVARGFNRSNKSHRGQGRGSSVVSGYQRKTASYNRSIKDISMKDLEQALTNE